MTRMTSVAAPRRAGQMLAALLISAAGTAQATEGYLALGHGAAERGRGGTGYAFADDAMSAAQNPASAAGVGRELSFGLELFSPRRGFTATGSGFIPEGGADSDREFFLIPNFAYNIPLEDGAAINISAVGNGGMNTTYPSGLAGCGSVFCGGDAGVDLQQLFLSVAYARDMGRLSWGVAPIVAVQSFKAYGVGTFAGLSVDGDSLNNNGRDYSYGVGLRVGLQYEATPDLTFGLVAQSKIDMSEFDDYAGLFEGGGDFDIPAVIGAGVAFDARDDLKILADVRHIFYSDVGAIGNAGDAGPLGAPGGAGFGWDDVTVVKLGLEWQQSETMTWRAGYAHATNPVGTDDVGFNILAPGIVEDHFTFGGSRKLNATDTLDFAVVYVPENTVSGSLPAAFGGGDVTLEMNQFAASVGWTHRF